MTIRNNEGFNQYRTFGIEIEAFFQHNESTEDTRGYLAWYLRFHGIQCWYERFENNGWHDRETGNYLRGNMEDRPYWKIKNDRSINAFNLEYKTFELISPILKGTEGLNEIQKVCDILTMLNCRVNKTCGLHVHHEARDFTNKTFRNLYGMYIRFERTIDSMMSASRRGEACEYAKSPLGDNSPEEIFRQLRLCEFEEDFLRVFPNRRCKLNAQAYMAHGTIEFRQHSGTCNAQKIVNWIVFTQMMVERAHNGDIRLKMGADDFKNLRKVLRGYSWMGADELQVEAINFMKKRIKELESREECSADSTFTTLPW